MNSTSGAQAPARTDSGALPQVRQLSSTRPLAKVEHTCSVCNGTIAIGSRYERILTKDLDALNPKRALRVVKWHLPYCPEASR